jgi:DNA-binding Lrp family transcriptional regulator
MEDAGVIQGYRAHLAPDALGLNFSALVFVTMREGTSHAVSEFEAAVQGIPQVIEAQRLFGDPDYLLHVITRDLPAFQQLYDQQLSALPNVLRLTSTLVMKRIVTDRVLPL